MSAAQGGRLVVQALYFTVIARFLGASDYGLFVGVVAFVAIVYPLGALGSGNLLIKHVARDQRSFPAMWGAALAKTASCAGLLVVLIVSASHFLFQAAVPGLLVLLVAVSDILSLNLINVAGQAFQAFERLPWTAGIYLGVSTSLLVGALVLLLIQRKPTALEWGLVYCLTSTSSALVACTLASVI